MVVQRFQSIELGDFLNGDSYLFAFRMELIDAKTNPMFQFMKQAKKKSKTSKKSPYSGRFFLINSQKGMDVLCLDVLFLDVLCFWTFCIGRFVFGRFVFGRFVYGRFVFGHFVPDPIFRMLS